MLKTRFRRIGVTAICILAAVLFVIYHYATVKGVDTRGVSLIAEWQSLPPENEITREFVENCKKLISHGDLTDINYTESIFGPVFDTSQIVDAMYNQVIITNDFSVNHNVSINTRSIDKKWSSYYSEWFNFNNPAICFNVSDFLYLLSDKLTFRSGESFSEGHFSYSLGDVKVGHKMNMSVHISQDPGQSCARDIHITMQPQSKED